MVEWKTQAKNAQEWSIVKLEDGTIGTISNTHYKRGRALVKTSDKHGVDIPSTEIVEVLVTTAMGMGELRNLRAETERLRVENAVMYAALSEASTFSGESARLRCVVELQRIARNGAGGGGGHARSLQLCPFPKAADPFGSEAAAGGGLQRILERWTGTTPSAFLFGVGLTALLQSSSATTITTTAS
jgi:hypothetical protein